MNKLTAEDIDLYRDEVCGRCPGSLWGAKSICRIHQLSIGQIEFCQQWEVSQAAPQSPASYRRGSERSSNKTEHMELVEEDLKDFPWMQREIERLRGLLDHVGAGLTGVYGLDGAMPKGKGRHADHVNREAQKREKHRDRLKELEAKVTRIENAAERVRDDRQRTVLECIMEGQRMNAIARHIGVSRQRLYELKHELVRFLADEIFGDDRKGIS
ncbi:hypothetical protein [Paenibacillus flagellatus]|uniref:Uncharacterized protein n=1 Tax=Paenibacillus flagellatus TaxID=2211139 RepID=A0A2V5K0C8_9BACL|nr:hypothetical protein [Paenibacillus flagellatus]PYI52541.1 hypothetical protein DLM86_20420 [Paenibacillus flagellatus]